LKRHGGSETLHHCRVEGIDSSAEFGRAIE
jgi:hypothetical protein